MPGPRFTCTLTNAAETVCGEIARVTIVDAAGDRGRGCPRHAVAAMDGIDGARVDWADTKGINEYERKALEITEEMASWRTPRREAAAEAEPEAGL
jgi:hypothetical protein